MLDCPPITIKSWYSYYNSCIWREVCYHDAIDMADAFEDALDLITRIAEEDKCFLYTTFCSHGYEGGQSEFIKDTIIILEDLIDFCKDGPFLIRHR